MCVCVRERGISKMGVMCVCERERYRRGGECVRVWVRETSKRAAMFVCV